MNFIDADHSDFANVKCCIVLMVNIIQPLIQQLLY